MSHDLTQKHDVGTDEVILCFRMPRIKHFGRAGGKHSAVYIPANKENDAHLGETYNLLTLTNNTGVNKR